MYDMYPWNDGSAARGADPATAETAGTQTAGTPTGGTQTGGNDTARTETARADTASTDTARTRLPRPRSEPAVSAVQVALDRRDNGGDPAAAPGTRPASPARQ